MNRQIQFDGSGLAYSCPKADIGCVSFDECRDCASHKGFKGFCADCSYDEPSPTEILADPELENVITAIGGG